MSKEILLKKFQIRNSSLGRDLDDSEQFKKGRDPFVNEELSRDSNKIEKFKGILGFKGSSLVRSLNHEGP